MLNKPDHTAQERTGWRPSSPNNLRGGPDISVIIPTHNYGHYLSDCLTSVLRQTEKNLEIIVIDDGSTDDTSEVVKSFKKNVKYIFQSQKGLSGARNTGIKCASGQFLMFLDSDDLLGPDTINAKASYLDKNPNVSLAVSPNYLFSSLDADGRPRIIGQWPLHRRNLDVHMAFFNIAPPHAFLARRNVAEAVGYFDETLGACEDYDYWARAVSAGFTPHFCGEGTAVYYRRHASSMSANLKRQHYFDAILHKRIFKLYFESKSLDPSRSHWLAFLAGVLTTLNRLEGQQTMIKDLFDLFSLAVEQSKFLMTSERTDSVGLPYLLLARCRLKELEKRHSPEAERFSEVSRLLGGLTLPAPRDAIRVINGWRQDPLDAKKTLALATNLCKKAIFQ